MSYSIDHRNLAEEMELYFFDEQVGGGLPMWLPNGAVIREELEKFIKEKEFKAGYLRVSSPEIARSSLYELSGHLKYYKQDMYPPISLEHQEFYLRPMNCPHHHLMYKSKKRSYRELPLRLAEYGHVYRHEASGSLRGIARVRGLCQNDAHIYVNPLHVKEEILNVLKLHVDCYNEIGLEGYRFRLSLHDPKSQEFEGDKEEWLRSENILRESLVEGGFDYFEEVGEAAFYGPKIDIQMRFYSEGKIKEESMSSVQLDFQSAERFDLEFVNDEGKNVRPYIIHRAPLGSHERFIAMLLEYFDGRLPMRFAPVQLLIYPLSEAAYEKAEELKQELMNEGIRVQVDARLGSSLSKRLVLGNKQRPYSMLILGENELEAGIVKIQMREKEEKVKWDEIKKCFK